MEEPKRNVGKWLWTSAWFGVGLAVIDLVKGDKDIAFNDGCFVFLTVLAMLLYGYVLDCLYWLVTRPRNRKP